jgi:hypothetical protein
MWTGGAGRIVGATVKGTENGVSCASAHERPCGNRLLGVEILADGSSDVKPEARPVHDGLGGMSRLARTRAARDHAWMEDAPLVEAPLYREETLTIMQALADLVVDVKAIRALLEENDEEEEQEEP